MCNAHNEHRQTNTLTGFMISAAPFINHLLARDDRARHMLQAHAGKSVCADLQSFRIHLLITTDGYLQNAGTEQQASVTIHIQPSDLPAMLQQRERAFSYVRIDGDADLANTVSALSDTLRWDAEADLSKVFGDIAAVRMTAGAKQLWQHAGQAHQRLQENVAEYLLEEKQVLVRPAEVRQQGQQIQKTRDDTERLLKRIERLERSRSC